MVAERFLLQIQAYRNGTDSYKQKKFFGYLNGWSILDNKVQVTKIPGTKNLLTTFGGNPTKNSI
jgi:hypothetical protein